MFDIGAKAAARPDLVRAEVRAGMWVENHTLTHRRLTRLGPARLTAEIADAQDVLRRLTGRSPTLMRPPFLAIDPRVRAVSRRLGLVDVLATVDSRDYAGASPRAIVDAARRLEPGGILLMHDWPAATIAAIAPIAGLLASAGCAPGASPRARRPPARRGQAVGARTVASGQVRSVRSSCAPSGRGAS